MSDSDHSNFFVEVRFQKVVQDLDELYARIRSAISDTVKEKRIGVAFSGGVDSTLVAKACVDLQYDVILLTVGFAGSHDIEFATKVNDVLRLPHKILELDPEEFDAISQKIRSKIQTDNLSWNENSIAFYHVARLAKGLGLSTVVTANGIDELFCGYNGYRDAIQGGQSAVMSLMESKLQNEVAMMGAVNKVCSEFGVKIVQPLLSEQFVAYAKSVPISEKITGPDDLYRKHAIRKMALKVGVPDISANAKKKALQYGTRIHKTLMKSR